jgi:hypothetical protein
MPAAIGAAMPIARFGTMVRTVAILSSVFQQID